VNRNDSELRYILLALLILNLDEEDFDFLRPTYYRILEKSERYFDGDDEIRTLFKYLIHGRPKQNDKMHKISRQTAISVYEGFRQSIYDKLKENNNDFEVARISLKEEIYKFKSSLDGQRQVAQDYFWLLTSGADINEVKLPRFIPVRVYIPNPVPKKTILNQIVSSLEMLLGDIEFETTDDFPEESGSFWKRLFCRAKELSTQKEVVDKLRKAERAVEIACLDKPQAEANHSQAQAAALLISALKETDKACIQAGSLLIVKATTDGSSAIYAKTLTPIELKRLEENQSMIYNPDRILNWLNSEEPKQLE